jgi:hypothetical protein
MELLLRKAPLVPHKKGAHQRMRPRSIGEIADPLHVGLPAQYPDIADKHILNRQALQGSAPLPDPNLHAVGATGPDPRKVDLKGFLLRNTRGFPVATLDRPAIFDYPDFNLTGCTAPSADLRSSGSALIPLQNLSIH